jgi:ABC-type multidrug transport system ATPase subunit
VSGEIDRPFPVEAEDLRREYAPGRGLAGVTFELRPAERLVFLGGNGSGKTTLVRLLGGLDRPDSGKLRVLGSDVARGSRAHLGRAGFALETSAHWPELSGRQNAGFVARSCGVAPGRIAPRLQELFRRADLAERADDPVMEYSFGMRRKLGLIEALSHEPDVAFLDDPTAGVDAAFALALAELLRERSGAGRATLAVTNDPDWAGSAATRVVFLEAGRIVASGTPRELVEELASDSEITITLAEVRRVPRPELAGVRSWSQEGGELVCLVRDCPAVLPRVLERVASAGARAARVEVKEGTLRDAFLLRTGRVLEA